MKGDPYCTHCGTQIRWYPNKNDDYVSHQKNNNSDLLLKLFNKMRNSNLTTDEKFNLFKKKLFKPDYILDEIREEISYTERRYKCKFIMVYTNPYPEVFVFFREDRFRDVIIFQSCYADRSSGEFDPDAGEFHYVYTKLYNEEKFQRKVSEIEKTGFELIEAESDITMSSSFDRLRARFSNGYVDVDYYIDDDLNFEKSYPSLNIENLYNFKGKTQHKDLLLAEIRRIEKDDRVRFKKASKSTCLAFEKANRDEVIIYRYDFESSRLEKDITCTNDEFKRIYSARYSFF